MLDTYTHVLCAKSLQSCLTLCNPKDCNPLGSSVHEILQARVLQWVAMPHTHTHTHTHICACVSVHFSHLVVSLWPHGLQHTRLPCPLPTPGAWLNSCPLSWWCHLTISSLSSLSIPAFNFPSIRVFSNESGLHIRWPKYCSFSISPSHEYSWLISLRIDLFDLLAVQRIIKSLLQHYSSKPSILWHTAFFMVSHIHTWLLENRSLN